MYRSRGKDSGDFSRAVGKSDSLKQSTAQLIAAVPHEPVYACMDLYVPAAIATAERAVTYSRLVMLRGIRQGWEPCRRVFTIAETWTCRRVPTISEI